MRKRFLLYGIVFIAVLSGSATTASGSPAITPADTIYVTLIPNSNQILNKLNNASIGNRKIKCRKVNDSTFLITKVTKKDSAKIQKVFVEVLNSCFDIDSIVYSSNDNAQVYLTINKNEVVKKYFNKTNISKEKQLLSWSYENFSLTLKTTKDYPSDDLSQSGLFYCVQSDFLVSIDEPVDSTISIPEPEIVIDVPHFLQSDDSAVFHQHHRLKYMSDSVPDSLALRYEMMCAIASYARTIDSITLIRSIIGRMDPIKRAQKMKDDLDIFLNKEKDWIWFTLSQEQKDFVGKYDKRIEDILTTLKNKTDKKRSR